MQEGSKSLGMLKTVQFGRQIFTVAYIIVDFKKLVSDLFHAGSALGKCHFLPGGGLLEIFKVL